MVLQKRFFDQFEDALVVGGRPIDCKNGTPKSPSGIPAVCSNESRPSVTITHPSINALTDVFKKKLGLMKTTFCKPTQ